MRPTKSQDLPNSKVSTQQVWPNEYNDGDRIEKQLMFMPSNYQYGNTPMKSILIYTGLKPWRVEEGQHEFLTTNCPVDRCLITEDKSKSKDVDATLYRDEYSHPDHTKTEKQVMSKVKLTSQSFKENN